MTHFAELQKRYKATASNFKDAFARHIKKQQEEIADLFLTASATVASVGTAELAVQNLDPRLIESIRITNPNLDNLHFLHLDSNALQGALNAAKGKYFEFLVADKLNAGENVGGITLPEGYRAELAQTPNQPAWDLKIVGENAEIANYLQLKATHNAGYIAATLKRYPDIQILTTSEAASDTMGGFVMDSGIENAALREQVLKALDTADTTFFDDFLSAFSPLLPLVIALGYEGYCLNIGKTSWDNFKMNCAQRSQNIVAASTAGALTYALGGGLLLAIPASFIGGWTFERTINQTKIADSFDKHTKTLHTFQKFPQAF